MIQPRAMLCVLVVMLGVAATNGDGAAAFERAEALRAAQKDVDAILEYDRGCGLGEMRACSELARACTAVSALLQVPDVAARLTPARCDALLQQTCKAGDVDSCGEIEVRALTRQHELEDARADAEARRALEKSAQERGARIVVDKSGPGWRRGASVRVRVNGAEVRDAVVVKKLTATIEVDDGQHKSRRIATLLPEAQYAVQGNPCAQWTLATTSEPAREDAEATRLHVDARALPARVFPIVVVLGPQDEAGQELASPGFVPLEVPESAMCIGAGARLRVLSKAAPKKPLFDADVVPHARMTSVLRFEGVDKWTLAVDP